MPSRAGRPNKDKQVVRDLAAQHGVDVIEMRIMLLKDCFKTIKNEIGKPRSRRSKQYFQAEEMGNKHLTELTPYLHGKLANVSVDAEVSHIATVIRAPEAIPDSKAWLEKYGPKRDDAVNAVLPFVKNLRDSASDADKLGIDDANAILNEAKRRTQEEPDDVIGRNDRKFLKGYDT